MTDQEQTSLATPERTEIHQRPPFAGYTEVQAITLTSELRLMVRECSLNAASGEGFHCTLSQLDAFTNNVSEYDHCAVIKKLSSHGLVRSGDRLGAYVVTEEGVAAAYTEGALNKIRRGIEEGISSIPCN